ncbi:VOC family protein [Georgenia sunbinii]|uniref:VOC family protein n=1 Tax=Georgenia sunbinii TaxID=3117728 RepID=UPI002F26DC94
MSVRWYTLVIDCHDHAAQAAWWAQALGWVRAYSSPEEIVLVPPHALEPGARTVPPERRGPGLVFVPVPEGKTVKNRLHLDLAPLADDDQEAEVRRLIDLGAHRVDVGQPSDVSWVVLADPEGNEFCVLSSRDD